MPLINCWFARRLLDTLVLHRFDNRCEAERMRFSQGWDACFLMDDFGFILTEWNVSRMIEDMLLIVEV